MTSIRRHWVLIGILVLAVVTRFVGLDQGLPFDYHWDERIYFHETLYAMANGLRRESTVSANLPYLLLPSVLLQWLWLLISGQASDFAGLVRSYIETPGPFVLLARSLWAFTGVLSVLWAYRIGRRVADDRVGLLGAFICAGAFLHVAESHFIKNDVPAGLFLLLAMERILDITERGERRDYFWAGAWVGLAMATKYYAASALIVIVLAHLLRRDRATDWRGWLPLGVSGLGGLITFTLTMPVLILDPQNLWDNVAYELGARFGSIPTDGAPQFLFYISEHLTNGLGSWVLTSSLVGMVLMLLRREPRKLLFVAIVALFFVAVNLRPNNFARYMVPLVPFLCVAAGYTVRSAVGQLLSIVTMQLRSLSMQTDNALLRAASGPLVMRRVTPLLLALVALFVSWESWTNVVRYDRYALSGDARTAAQSWIEANVPKSATMVIEGGESFNRTSNLGPQVWRTADQLVTSGPNSPQEAFYWNELLSVAPLHYGYNLNLVGSVGSSPQEIDGKRVTAPVESVDFWGRPDYFVLISWRSDALRPGSTAPFWASLDANYDLAATFSCFPCFPEDYYAWRIDYPTLRYIPLSSGDLTGGPEVRIFKRR